MKPSNTSNRLREIMSIKNLRQIDILNLAEPIGKKHDIKLSKTDLTQYVNGKTEPGQNKLWLLGQALNVSEAWLMGFDVPMEREQKTPDNKPLNAPTTTDDFVTFPVIGEVAAGYEHIAVEDWSGDTIEIPTAWLQGRDTSEYFVLRIKGDSMFPEYRDGDKVLVLRQNTMDYSGQIGVVIYESENATVKKIEYKHGEDWIRLVPINPNYPQVRIENADLERCCVLGIPRILIREVKD